MNLWYTEALICIMATILITGGSGLIGTALTAALMKAGHTVRHLSRTPGERRGVRAFAWDVRNGTVDPAALQGVDHIVHLAGAGIADKRWTTERVNELIDSRAASIRLLWMAAQRGQCTPKSLVSAAGMNFYGAVTSDRIHVETDAPGQDTIGRISREWETAVDEWRPVCRVVKLRTPIVLSSTGGALAKLALPVRFGLGAALGSGRQWMTWVHIDDLAAAYVQAITQPDMSGAYNVSAPDQVSNSMFMETVAKVLGRPSFLPAVPAFALRLALGEPSTLLLEGSRASSDRLTATGFRFSHPDLSEALKDLLRS